MLNSSRDVLEFMSSESEITERSETSPALPKAIRTVSPGYRSRPDSEMNAIGLGYAALLAILLLPLLPFLVLVWLVSRIVSAIRASVGEETEPATVTRRRRGRVV